MEIWGVSLFSSYFPIFFPYFLPNFFESHLILEVFDENLEFFSIGFVAISFLFVDNIIAAEAQNKVVVIPIIKKMVQESPNVTIRSGNIFWDYRISESSTGPKTILHVSSDKNFILTDIVVTDDSCDCRILEGTTVKASIKGDSNIHFAAGIPFSPGSDVIVSQPYCGAIQPGNIVFGVTISGYEY
jgi:hypothetical protein